MQQNTIKAFAAGVSTIATGTISVLEIGKKIQYSDPFVASRIASLGRIIADANKLLADIVNEKAIQLGNNSVST